MLLACSDGCRAMCFALQVVACCCMAESSDLVRGLAKPFLPEKPFNTNFISRKCQSSINSAQNYDVKRVIAVSFQSYFFMEHRIHYNIIQETIYKSITILL